MPFSVRSRAAMTPENPPPITATRVLLSGARPPLLPVVAGVVTVSAMRGSSLSTGDQGAAEVAGTPAGTAVGRAVPTGVAPGAGRVGTRPQRRGGGAPPRRERSGHSDRQGGRGRCVLS